MERIQNKLSVRQCRMWILSVFSLFTSENLREDVHVNINAQPTIMEKSKCWFCGLYQTESRLCLSCENCNQWTLSKILTN